MTTRNVLPAIRVSTNRPVDFTVAHLTFAPGGTTGWHVHPGPVLVVVKSGTITKYAADCSATRFTAGRAFVERGPRDLNMVLNEARTHAETIVTFITRWERRLATTPPHHPDANP